MPGLSGTMHLKIMKGIAKIPGDTLSSETGLDEIDLLEPKGFSCDEYLIRMPALKSSAVYADSPLTDGRTLISGALGNVTETIRLTLNSDTIVQMAAMLSKLGRMKQDCNDFWDTFVQIEPVYLKHQIVGEPGPRYALLYNIDIDVEAPTNPNDPTRTVTLQIEREYGWRGIAPGDNPKHWTYYTFNRLKDWTLTNAGLISGSDHLFIDSAVNNKAEINTNASTWISKNFVDVPAAKIPGDLPALTCLVVSILGPANSTAITIGKSTKRTSGNNSRTTSNNQLTIYTFNAADCTLGTDTTKVADVGAPRGIGGSAASRTDTTFATATMATRLRFSNATYPNGLSPFVERGRYMAFLRARVSAAATVNLQLAIQTGSLVGGSVTTPVTLTDTAGGSPPWALVYLGTITIPDSDPNIIGPDGYGVDTSTSLNLLVQASRTAGAGNLQVADMLFVPIDEGAIKAVASQAVGTNHSWVFDNTGYFLHGKTGDSALDLITTAGVGSLSSVPEPKGNGIYLSPGMDNRLMFLSSVESTQISGIADPVGYTIRLNIVPRWSGLRDV